MKSYSLSLAALAHVLLLSNTAYAEDGALDPLFGSNGIQTTSFSSWDDEARDLAIQPDGKIVLAGRAGNNDGTEDDFALLRYNPDGQLDTTFGIGGKVTTAFYSPDDSDVAEAVAIQADGKIVAAGWSIAPAGNRVFALARYLPNGQLDPSFGVNGRVTTNIRNSDDFINDIAIQVDGKIVVTGGSRVFNPSLNQWHYDIVTARYLSNGQLDPSFDVDGIAITPIGVSDEWGNGIVIQRDGKIVVAGASCNADNCDTINGNYDFAFVRYLSDGALDTSFNDDGKASFASAVLIYSDGASKLTLQPDGAIVAAGGRNKGDADYRQLSDFALMRVLPNGQLDTSFGDRGWVKTPIGLDVSGAADIAYRNDGKLVVAGFAINNTINRDIALALYNRDGSLDTSFGKAGNGIVTTPIGLGDDYAQGVALQSDGKIVIAGGTDSGSYHLDFASVRYEAPDVTPDVFSLGTRSNVDPAKAIEAPPVVVTGITAPTLVLVRNGEYSINGGPYTSSVGMVNPGDVVTLRHTSSAELSGIARSTLHIGGVESDFTTITSTTPPSGGGGTVGLVETTALLMFSLLVWFTRRRKSRHLH